MLYRADDTGARRCRLDATIRVPEFSTILPLGAINDIDL